jgi:hypothetical protein
MGPPKFVIGARVCAHGLASKALNGAFCLVEAPPDGNGLVSVRVTHPASAAGLYPGVTQLSLHNVRPCQPDELGELYEQLLPTTLWAEVRASVRELQHTADEDTSWREKRSLARKCALQLWHVAAQCIEAGAWLDAAESPAETGRWAVKADNVRSAESAPASAAMAAPVAQLYAFLHATCCSHVGFACALRGDGAGELAAYHEAFLYSLHRPGLGALADACNRHGLVGDLALRCGEALRQAGRFAEALPPLALAEAEAAEDEVTLARCAGTTALAHLGMGDLTAAAAAAERELAILRGRPFGAGGTGSLTLARSLTCLACISVGRAAALCSAVPLVRRQLATAISDAAMTIEAAFLEVREHSRAPSAAVAADQARHGGGGLPNADAWATLSTSLNAAMGRLGAMREMLRATVVGGAAGATALTAIYAPGQALLHPEDRTLSRVHRPRLSGSTMSAMLPGTRVVGSPSGALRRSSSRFSRDDSSSLQGSELSSAQATVPARKAVLVGAARIDADASLRRAARQQEKLQVSRSRAITKLQGVSMLGHMLHLVIYAVKLVMGKYTVETYLTDAEAINESYELLALLNAMMVGAISDGEDLALRRTRRVGRPHTSLTLGAVYVAPTAMWDEWNMMDDFNLTFMGLSAQFVLITGVSASALFVCFPSCLAHPNVQSWPPSACSPSFASCRSPGNYCATSCLRSGASACASSGQSHRSAHCAGTSSRCPLF